MSTNLIFVLTNAGTWGYHQNCAVPYHPEDGGFELRKGKSKVMRVPNDWCSGRIWARTKCSTASGAFKCETGDCGPGVKCIGTGAAPATLAEFTFEANPNIKSDT